MLPAAQNAEPLIAQSKNLKKTTSVLHWDTQFTKMGCSSFELKRHIILIVSVLVLIVLFFHVRHVYCCTTTFKSFHVLYCVFILFSFILIMLETKLLSYERKWDKQVKSTLHFNKPMPAMIFYTKYNLNIKCLANQVMNHCVCHHIVNTLNM